MTEPAVDDEFTELFNADIPRVDLVGKGANGLPFLIAKADAQAGVLGAEFVRDLIEKATPAVEPRDDITMTGSPAAITKMIYEAATRQKEPAMAEATIIKDDAAPVDVADIVPDAPGGTTAETIPGSPDWEKLDADTATNAIGVLGRVKAALEWLANREVTEAVTGDEGDLNDAWDLEDASMQIDCIIRRLAGFAATETLDTVVEEELEEVGKAIAFAGSLDLVPIQTIEKYSPIVKAGRVLSTANEQAIRSAVESLSNVLATLPAPTDDDQSVAKSQKETTVTETKTPEEQHTEAIELLLKGVTEEGWRVEKAAGDPQVAVYDADGTLVGTVDPSNLIAIAAPQPPDGGDAQGGDEPPPAADAPAADVTAPAEDAATIPGTDTIAAPAPTDDDTVAKAAQAGAAAALAEVLPMLTEKLGASAETAELIKGLQERVDELAKMPDDRKSPRLNGGTGAAGIVDRDGTEADGLADLRKAVDDAETPPAKQAAKAALAYAEIHARFAK